MAKVVGDIAVQVGADISKLQAGMAKGSKSVKGFGSDATAMGVKFAKAGAVVGVAALGIAAGIAKMASNAGTAAREIQNLSDISGVSAEQFQRLAAAGKEVGFSQEKMADIFKDVNDKFGDFMANGAGPLKDFFDNIAPAVGVTAEQFAKLSGPEALQLYQSSLEKAGLSQQQMTFYMEALASDATALIPLLANNGREMKNLGDAAQEAGRIISNDAVAAGAEMDRKMTELAETLRVKATAAVLEYSDEIIAAADWITGTMLPAIDDFIGAMGQFAKDMEPAIDALQRFMGLANAAAGVEVGSAVIDPGVRNDDVAGANSLGGGDTSNSGAWPLDENGNVIMDDGTTLPTINVRPEPIVPLANRGGGRSGGGRSGGKKGRGGSGGPDRDDFEALEQRYIGEAELIAQQQEDALEKLREFREAKLATEEEFNELEANIKADHADKLARIERDAQQQRMRDFSGALGDLATLMQSGNEKLFKVGQAAAIADAVVNGYSAAVAAWEKGMKVGGPGVAAAFTAASLAKTGALISSIKSASSSGSLGGGAAGGSTAAATAEPIERRVAEFRFTGGNVLDPRAIVDAMNDAYDQGYQIKGILA